MKDLKFDSIGLLTGIAQDLITNQILMVAMMNGEAIDLTLKSGLAALLVQKPGNTMVER